MKVYEKPRVYIERFELTQHIATCAYDMSDFKTIEDCSADSGVGEIYFLDSRVCKDLVRPDGTLEDFCYTNGSSENNIFNS